ncbi:hypothetical protein [Singulisphaera sp. PoT]|uniref:hypothetical protein n=1 Tax=Singulisphaera sp. PoT TaxID=3411797 RepID=UPI003BF552E5
MKHDKPRFNFPGRGEHHEGYAFDLPDGRRCEVPAETIQPDRYVNRAMSHDEALDVCIAFGLEMGMPITPTKNGIGYDVTVPAEYLKDLLESGGQLPL